MCVVYFCQLDGSAFTLYQSESNQSINILSVSMSTFRAVLTFYFPLFIKIQTSITFFGYLLSFMAKVFACTVKVESIKKSNVCPVDDVTLEPPVSLQSTLFFVFSTSGQKSYLFGRAFEYTEVFGQQQVNLHSSLIKSQLYETETFQQFSVHQHICSMHTMQGLLPMVTYSKKCNKKVPYMQ